VGLRHSAEGNANFAWLQHMLARLSSRGRAGIVLANGSMSSQQSGEGEIRKAMVEADVVECMVALPGQLFSNTQIPACLWFLAANKKAGVRLCRSTVREVLFIDARKSASRAAFRARRSSSPTRTCIGSRTYHRWRGTDFSDGAEYEDVPRFLSFRGPCRDC
jgi:type I restriction enzyme M protein